LTFERGKLGLLVPWASPVEGFLESFLRTESLFSMGGLFPSFWLALLSCLQVVERNLIMGGAVGFHLFMLLLLGNDDNASVPANVDYGAKVAHGGVIEVAALLLVRLDRVVLAFGALHIDEFTAFLLDVTCIFYLDVVWEFNTHCYVHIFVDWIKEVVIIVLEPLYAFIVFTGVNHEHFSIGCEAFGTPRHLALVFVGVNHEHFLKREFVGCGNGSRWT
jgi:hypothetical protein